jgi:hypothetical protein
MCLYCGLESPVATNHANTDECISALRRELYRLTERLLHKRLNHTALSSPAREPGAAPARTSWDPFFVDQGRTPRIAANGPADSNPVA